MDDYLRSIVGAHGVFLRQEALAVGVNDRAIQRQVRAGAWTRVRHGAYTFTELWEPLDEVGRGRIKTRAALRTAKADGVPSHTSALAEFGTTAWDLDFGEVHLTRTDARAGRREAGIRQHRGHLGPDDLVTRNGLVITAPARTGLDVCTLYDVEHGAVVLDGLVYAGLTSRQELHDRYDDMTHWPSTLHLPLVLRLCDPGSQTAGESRSKYLFWREGLPRPELQYEIRDENGMVVAITDFAWPELGLFGEFDGKVKYQRYLRAGERPGDAVFREKRREDLIRRITGWRCIRLVWADLYHPAQTAAWIRREMNLGRRTVIA